MKIPERLFIKVIKARLKAGRFFRLFLYRPQCSLEKCLQNRHPREKRIVPKDHSARSTSLKRFLNNELIRLQNFHLRGNNNIRLFTIGRHTPGFLCPTHLKLSLIFVGKRKISYCFSIVFCDFFYPSDTVISGTISSFRRFFFGKRF